MPVAKSKLDARIDALEERIAKLEKPKKTPAKKAPAKKR